MFILIILHSLLFPLDGMLFHDVYSLPYSIISCDSLSNFFSFVKIWLLLKWVESPKEICSSGIH